MVLFYFCFFTIRTHAYQTPVANRPQIHVEKVFRLRHQKANNITQILQGVKSMAINHWTRKLLVQHKEKWQITYRAQFLPFRLPITNKIVRTLTKRTLLGTNAICLQLTQTNLAEGYLPGLTHKQNRNATKGSTSSPYHKDIRSTTNNTFSNSPGYSYFQTFWRCIAAPPPLLGYIYTEQKERRKQHHFQMASREIQCAHHIKTGQISKEITAFVFAQCKCTFNWNFYCN